MVQLQKDHAQFKEAGIRLVGVSYDSVKVLDDFATKNKIEYPLLSDDESKVIEAYKVLNKNVRKGSPQAGIPHPATFVVDSNGIIRAKLPGSVFRRHSTEALLDAAKKIKGADSEGDP